MNGDGDNAPDRAHAEGPRLPVRSLNAGAVLLGVAFIFLGLTFALWLFPIEPKTSSAGKSPEKRDAPKQVEAPPQSGPRILRGHDRLVGILHFSKDGSTFLSGDGGEILRIWDYYAGESLCKIDASGMGLRRAILTAGAPRVIACGRDPGIRMWSARTGRFLREFRGHAEVVTAVRQVPGKEQLLSASLDASLILWDMADGRILRRFGTARDAKDVAPQTLEDLAKLDGHFTWIRDVVVLPDGKRAISAGNDAVLFIWNVESGELIDRLIGHGGVIMGLALSPDGAYVASVSVDKAILVWDVENKKLLRRFEHQQERVPSLAFAPNNHVLAIGEAEGVVRFLDVISGAEAGRIALDDVEITSLAIHPNGEVVLGCGNGEIRIYPPIADQ